MFLFLMLLGCTPYAVDTAQPNTTETLSCVDDVSIEGFKAETTYYDDLPQGTLTYTVNLAGSAERVVVHSTFSYSTGTWEEQHEVPFLEGDCQTSTHRITLEYVTDWPEQVDGQTTLDLEGASISYQICAYENSENTLSYYDCITE